MARSVLALAAGLIMASAGAQAGSHPSAIGSMFDVAFGATLTSDYISRGITQTDHGAAIQGYVEPSLGIFYGGVWASNVTFGGAADTEIDAYIGVRPEFDRFAFDFGYNHAFYMAMPSSNAGEFFATVDVAVTDNVTVGGQFFVNPVNSATYAEANADVLLINGFGVSGALGFVNGTTPYTTWNAGIYYAPVDWAKIDLRYSATNLSAASCATITGLTGNECDARVMVGLSIDTSLSALRGKNN